MPVIHHGKTSVSDKPWDAGENVKRLREGEKQSYYDQMFMWRSADAKAKSDYKFPFHFVSADGDIGEASLKAAAAIIASLNGGRGGADIPDADRRGVYEEAVKVYKAAGVGAKDIPQLRANSTGFVSGNLRVLQKLNNYEFGVELRLLRDGVNDNLWDYQNVEQYYKTFLGRPILCAYVGGEVGDGHNSRIKVTPQGVKYYSYTDSTAERIVGTISEDPKDITLVKEGGHTWIVAKGKLFAFYAPELVDKIVRTGRMDVSAETDIKESYQDGKIERYPKWVGLGVTVLGDRVSPAVPGAHIAALAAMEDEFKNLKLRAASLQRGPQNPVKHQETIHKGVKKTMAENRVLLGALSAKFPDYRVMAANDDGTKVCLLSKDGADAFTYEFAESDKGAVIQERINPVVLSARYCFGETGEIEVSVDAVTSEMRNQIGLLSKQVMDLTTERDGLKADLSKMTEEKKASNRKAAKEAVTARLNEINANRPEEDKIAEDCVLAVNEAIDKGEYDQKENAEDCARMAVNAVAMEKQTEIDKKKAESVRLSQKCRYPWESGFSGPDGGGSEIDHAFDRIGNVK